MTVPASVGLALDWLTNSHIRHNGHGEAASGGVNQGYNFTHRNYPFIYSEITGYAVSTFVCAYYWTNDARYLELAREAAAFVLRHQNMAANAPQHGAVLQGLSLPDLQPMLQYYSFDLAMCLQGLLDLYRVEPSTNLQTSTRAMGDWLINTMQQADGSFLAMYDQPHNEWKHPGDNFFDDAGCLHAKHAIGLLKLNEITGDTRYRDAAVRVCDWVLALQDDSGAIRAHFDQPQVVSHPHCYAVEGLLYAHYVTGSDRYLEASYRAGEWLLGAQNADGSINIEYNKPWWRMGRRVVEKVHPHRVTDATSQALRIWLLLYYLKDDTRFLDAARRAGQHLAGMQRIASPDRDAIGGFEFWSGHDIMFTWATMFAAHALYALENVSRPDAYTRLITELF